MFAGNKDMQVYKDFWEWAEKSELFKMRKNHTLEHADLAPLAYLHIALEGNLASTAVKHLLIDEMQDYSPIRYKIIQKLYPCRKTILGDASQSVNPYGWSTAGMIRQVLATGEIMKLCKSYRFTFEITDFAQKILPSDAIKSVKRHGEHPAILHFKDGDDEREGLARLVSAFKDSPYRSMAIVCKTETRARDLFARLQAYSNSIYFLSSQSTVFAKGIIVTFSHMTKGLEFDEVVVPLQSMP